MRIQAQLCAGGSQRFFFLSFGNGGLKSYYNLNFTLLYNHKIDFRIIDDVIPWEKDIYLNLLTTKIKEENEEAKVRQAEMNSRRR